MNKSALERPPSSNGVNGKGATYTDTRYEWLCGCWSIIAIEAPENHNRCLMNRWVRPVDTFTHKLGREAAARVGGTLIVSRHKNANKTKELQR